MSSYVGFIWLFILYALFTIAEKLGSHLSDVFAYNACVNKSLHIRNREQFILH